MNSIEAWAGQQQGGNHYQQGIEPIAFIEANGLPFSEGNVVKYVSRHSKLERSVGQKSLLKALDYLVRILKARYGVLIKWEVQAEPMPSSIEYAATVDGQEALSCVSSYTVHCSYCGADSLAACKCLEGVENATIQELSSDEPSPEYLKDVEETSVPTDSEDGFGRFLNMEAFLRP